MRKFLLFGFITFSAVLFADEYVNNPEFSAKQEADEMDALKKWIRDKRLVTIKEIGGDLSLSGEVRVEYQSVNEKKDGINQRAPDGQFDIPARAMDVEVNLMLDYRTDRLWASIKLEFDNDMGVKSGTTGKIALEKAYFGGRIIDDETFSLDGEIGRRFLGNVFTSKVEFGAIYDGVLLRFNKSLESIGNFYVNLGGFVVNDREDHYGGVGEVGLLDIADTGLEIIYSAIDWKKHYERETTDLRYNFIVSQLTLSFLFTPVCWNKLIKPYIAGSINHLAKETPQTTQTTIDADGNEVVVYSTKAQFAWYVGISVGRVKKKGDWAIDLNYQYVEAQAIPDFDASGIGRGNAGGVGFYTNNKNGSGGPTTNKTAVGNGNYRGWKFELLYALTDNLTLFENFQISDTLNPHIGPDLKYKFFEVELIYAF